MYKADGEKTEVMAAREKLGINEQRNSPEMLKENRVNNSFRSFIVGFAAMLLNTFVPFLIRMLMMKYLGENYVGLNGVLQSTIWILNISELGIGSVMVYFLYEPAAQGDERQLNAYLMEIRRLYRFVSGLIFIGGIMTIPFLPRLVSGEIPENENIYLLFLCYLAAIVLQYWMWPEIASLFTAFQRADLQYIVALLAQSVTYGMQILAICVLRSFFLYIAAVVFQVVAAGLLQFALRKKYFGGCIPKGRLEQEKKKEVYKRIFSMIGHQMDEKLLGNVDNLFISAFLGLEVVAVYGNYMFIVTAVSMLLNTVYSSVIASIGNAMAVESRKSNMIRFDCMLFLNNLLAGWSTACMLCMCQTFMGLWMPEHLLSMDLVVLICLYSYIIQMRRSVQTFKNAGGMWYNDRFKPYISMTVDLVLDYILIKTIGLHGAIISTVICVGLIEFPWEMHVLFRDYFNCGEKKYLKRVVIYTMINGGFCTMLFFIANHFIAGQGVIALVKQMLLCTGGAVAFYLLIYKGCEELRIWKETITELVFH